MQNLIKLKFIKDLEEVYGKHKAFIHVIIGPRQVGKTTGIKTFLEGYAPETYHYISADGEVSQHPSWLEDQWRTLKAKDPEGLLIVDEVQKVENWSEVVKKLWDKQKDHEQKIKLIVLGSSSLTIQKGLSESLTGRFKLLKVHAWNSDESQRAYGLNFEDFLVYGGYPGSYIFLDDRVQWLNYMKESIVDTVIGKDILKISRVKSPALFKQCFHLACSYGAQEISYTKLLGQLQDRGNVELVKHYLELFEGAFLLKQLAKYSSKKVLSRASSPKILPLCPALYSITKDADLNEEERGRAFEIAVGAELSRLPGELYYWRERDHEVDFVYEFGKKTIAMEVKSGKKTQAKGLSKFLDKFERAEAVVVTPDNFNKVLESINQNMSIK